MTEAEDRSGWVKRPTAAIEGTGCTLEDYQALYARSIEDSDTFWAGQADRLDWIEDPTVIANWSYDPVSINWFEDGVLNICHNAVDRHVAAGHGASTALIFEPDDPAGDVRRITYAQLQAEVIRMANTLRKMGVAKGDRVTIYMPMVPEGAFAMLACARIGAIHSVIFGGFSPEAIAGRVEDCRSDWIVTADEGLRGGKRIPLKGNVDAALDKVSVKAVLVLRHTGGEVAMTPGRDHWYHELSADIAADCPCEPMQAEDPLFILYTSGSTGKPKGVVHASGGYLVYAALTHEVVFDYHDGDVYWCTADVGWVTGHSYIVYGPLANGATTLMFEGVPTYPDASRFWEVCDKHKVNQFYTAPTALRALMGQGDGFVDKCDLSSLKLLGTVGEPINPEAWRWFRDVVGGGTAPIVDTWWQTETGAIMISPLPGVTATKPGSAMTPLPGISAKIVDDDAKPLGNGGNGYLVLDEPWPSMLRGIWGDMDRYRDTYWSRYAEEGWYFAGDGAKYDDDGALWVLGRVDDVMNVSGHRISTSEVESALVSHHGVAEAAVVGAADDTTGQGIVAFVILRAGVENTGDDLIAELKAQVSQEISPIAKPREISIVPELPKTRSGKIMRRLLRDVAEGRDLGDTSTLVDPKVFESITKGR